MILKGQKIKAIKNIGDIIKVGDVYVVEDIIDGSIKFVGSKTKGIMNFKELSEYFEGYAEPKYEWTDWGKKSFSYITDSDAKIIPVEYRYNGKRVQVKTSYRNHKDEDAFDLDKGLLLCKARLLAKLATIDAEILAESM